MKFIRPVSLALCFAGILALNAAPASAKPEFAKKEKETCPTCHVMSEFPKRNDVGECYKRHGLKDLVACKKDPKN